MSPLRLLMIAAMPLTLAAVSFAAAPRESVAGPSTRAPAAHSNGVDRIAQGKQLVEKLQCTRCHAATAMPVAEAPRSRSCAGCHAWIAGTAHDPVEYERQHARFPYWERYVENVGSFLATPDLSSSGARLDEAWIASYVLDPYEVRPGLYERMMRVPVTEDEAKSIAAFLRSARKPLDGVAADAAKIPASGAPAHVAAGKELFEELRCGTCHAIGAIDRDAKAGSPDLAYAAARMAPADIAAFIADPAAFGSSGSRLSMPDFDLSAEQAARLRDYVLSVAPVKEAIAPIPADLPLLARRVEWEEVSTKVFGKICVHCHMTASKNGGEGGPGNTGGLGFEGKGLDLETWSELAKSTVLAPRAAGEEAPLIARLRRRAVEHNRELAGPAPGAFPEGERGMPMAMPALTPVEMQLVRTWLAQGAPGPDGRKALAVEAATTACRMPKRVATLETIDRSLLLDCYAPDAN